MSRPVFGHVATASAMEKGALLSPCGTYRYRLWRVWDADLPVLVWVLLNPSTADGEQDDPTLRRCIGFARRWHHGGVVLVNLFAYRATDPHDLAAAADPVGPENDEHIRRAVQEPLLAQVVCGWGAHPSAQRGMRDRLVRGAICSWRGQPMCIGHTKDGHPRHPLYVPATATLEPYR